MNKKFLLIGGVLLAGFSFFKGRSSVRKEEDTRRNVIDDAKKEVRKSKITHSDSWFSQSCDLIALNLRDAWKSSTAIRRVLIRLAKLKNKDEYLYLVQKFGLRSGGGVSLLLNKPLNTWLLYFLDTNYTFRNSSGKKRTVNALLVAKEILKRRNVDLM